MSLDIIAYDPKETKARKNKFKAKYGISCDKFNEETAIFEPSENQLCYFLHPELLESDTEKYNEMEKDAELVDDVNEIDNFHIEYGHFHFLKKRLGGLVGVRYDYVDMLYYHIYYDDSLEGTPLIKFFFHSDCDDEFSTEDIQKSYKQFSKLYDKEKLQKEQKGEWAEEINSFLKFWKESADKKLQWEFC